MSDVSPVLALPYIAPAQAQKHVTHNEALARLDVAVQLAVRSRDLMAPPTAPDPGDRYLVPGGASGEWAGQDDRIAVRVGSAWVFHDPVAGWRAHVLDDGSTAVFDGTAWSAGGNGLSAETLGVNASADATNRLAVSSGATLLTHEGDDHRLKINKAAATDTASLLFQTDWSGRAEMGCIGSDDFAIKVSDDGVTWVQSMQFDGATGLVSGAAVQTGPGDTTAGRLARADYAYGRGNVVGTVSESGGAPTGAVIEQGTNANGSYVRFADGTQICSHTTFSNASGPATWVYPALFGNIPVITLGVGAAGARVSTYQSAGPSSVAVNGFTLSGARAVFSVAVVATGRWF